MSEKLKELHNKCTEKQAKFVDLLVGGQEKPEAYKNGGFKPKNRRIAQIAACCLLTTNINVMAYYEAKKTERDKNIERTLNITRTTQLKSLNDTFELAKILKNPSAMVSALREMNEMQGYHRENAPNAEREAARRAAMDAEKRKVAEKVAKLRTDEESGEVKIVKIG